MPGVIGYVRVSTTGQAQEGVSLDDQASRITAWAEFHGRPIKMIFIDAGMSGGRADNRPELQKALSACGRGDVMVVYSLSRLARSTTDTLAIARRLERQGSDLASLTEQLETTTASGKMLFRILAVLGEFERDIISERTSAAMRHLKALGRFTGGFRPIGFVVGEGGVLVPREEEQVIMSRARELRLKGLSLRCVAHQLSVEGYVLSTSTKFHAEQIRRWCRSPY